MALLARQRPGNQQTTGQAVRACVVEAGERTVRAAVKGEPFPHPSGCRDAPILQGGQPVTCRRVGEPDNEEQRKEPGTTSTPEASKAWTGTRLTRFQTPDS